MNDDFQIYLKEKTIFFENELKKELAELSYPLSNSVIISSNFSKFVSKLFFDIFLSYSYFVKNVNIFLLYFLSSVFLKEPRVSSKSSSK